MIRLAACLLYLFITSPLFAQPDAAQKAFLKELGKFSGKSLNGEVLSPLKDNDPFKGKTLTVHFGKLEKGQIRVPFWVGEDHSRTWVITLDEKGLLLKHDHRHADGTPDEVTNYGGYASATGTVLSQSFPADDFTAKLIPAAATNVWTIEFNADKTEVHYILKRDGQLRFHARFK